MAQQLHLVKIKTKEDFVMPGRSPRLLPMEAPSHGRRAFWIPGATSRQLKFAETGWRNSSDPTTERFKI